ncbi:hypothetical protein ABEX78_20185 [Priestia megaterium]
MKKITCKFLIRSAALLLINAGINIYFISNPNWYTAISTAVSVPLGLAIIEYALRDKEESF